jgi:hypothetical protein
MVQSGQEFVGEKRIRRALPCLLEAALQAGGAEDRIVVMNQGREERLRGFLVEVPEFAP